MKTKVGAKGHVTHSAVQVPADSGVSQQLQADLTLPLPAVLYVLVAAQAVFAGWRVTGSVHLALP